MHSHSVRPFCTPYSYRTAGRAGRSERAGSRGGCAPSRKIRRSPRAARTGLAPLGAGPRNAARTGAGAPRAGVKPPTFRSWLLTLVEFDGDIRVYFRDIAQFIADDFDALFRNCEDYGTTRNFEGFWSWIKRYQINSNLFYSRYGDLSLVRIKQLQDFKRRFDEFVAEVRPANGSPPKSLDGLFDQFLARTQQYASDFPTPGGIYKPKG